MTSAPLDLPDDILAAFPATRSEIRIGYARVSTRGKSLDRQVDALPRPAAGGSSPRSSPARTPTGPSWPACLDFLRPGDTLVVPELWPARPQPAGPDLHRRRTAPPRHRVQSLHESLDTTTPGGRLVFHVFAALAEFIRELIVEGTHEGLAAARARGVRLGRPTGDDPGADPVRPRPAHPAREQRRHLDRQAARREPVDDLQLHPRPARTTRSAPEGDRDPAPKVVLSATYAHRVWLMSPFDGATPTKINLTDNGCTAVPQPRSCPDHRAPHLLIIAHKGYVSAELDAYLAERGVRLLRPSYRNRTPRPGEEFLKPIRQLIESVNDTLKGQLDLELHGGRSICGVAVRVAQRILALIAIWHNRATDQPITRSLIAYDH